ncbi:MAG: ATP-binding cassette domain-containing protein [Planctomycetaceae bacterium]|nr:ATP-binding cassette domain-containing protein [Planctomycetaceae bacterium]
MPLLSLVNLTFTYASPTLLDHVTLHIDRGERIGLVGRNGAGKSTLMKLIAGRLRPDDGTIDLQPDIVVAQLDQEVPEGAGQSSFDVAAEGFGETGHAVSEYRALNQLLAEGIELTDEQQARYDQASHQLADHDLWTGGDRLDALLNEMNLPADAPFASLSAGMKRRVLLARAMIRNPDILLLDEPTNHLDIESILWLQGYLSRFAGTLIFVTHDRVFLQEMANRIIEIDRGRLFDWTCDYETFLRRRDQLLEAEAQQQALFDKKLAEEERWIRQGIKARRTRNEGRVRALKKMREERASRRDRQGTAKLQLQDAERSGRLVAELRNVTHGFDGRTIIEDFSTTVFRGDRIGIIGPNGAGKSTLLRILLGQLKPDSGTVRLGTNLEIAYFDQLRDSLDQNKSARDNIGDGKDYLEINGARRHVMGYLQDFLFAPDRSHTLVHFLSGGERNRLLLAKMMSRPANILVLDEPTNDLDAETLELLEETLPEFKGTILLVSHDRAFLNNMVTSTIVFEGDGVVEEFDGGYDDWLRQKKQREAQVQSSRPNPAPTQKSVESAVIAPAKKSVKRSYRDQRELEELPDRIAALEQRHTELHDVMAAPGFYQQSGDVIARTRQELDNIDRELLKCFQRWEELESGS